MAVKRFLKKHDEHADAFGGQEERPLSVLSLAVQNIRRNVSRSFGLAVISAVAAFVFFASGILSAGMKNGLGSLKARLGADLLVVPLGYDKKIEGLLIKGEPSYFYFDKSVEEKIRSVQGVKAASAQFFMTSLNQDCCAVPVQFIGFDPASDFSVQPWISKSYARSVKDGELVLGCDIATGGSRTIRFFGRDYFVAASLEKTGTGLDQAVYANMNTLRDLLAAAKNSGLAFTKSVDPASSISSVLVRLENGVSADEAAHNIRAAFDGLQVIKAKNVTGSIGASLKIFQILLNVFSALFFASALISLATVFSLLFSERKKEFAVLRSLGLPAKGLSRLVLAESALICAAGGAAGTFVSAALLLPFSALVGRSLGLPYLLPRAPIVVLLALASAALSALLGPLSAAREAMKLVGREAGVLIKEGE